MSLALIVALAALATAGWKLSQFARAPKDRGLQVVTICTVFVAAALAAQYVLTGIGHDVFSVAAYGKLVQNFLLIWFFCALLCYLASALAPEALFKWGWSEVGAATSVCTALVLAFAAGGMHQSWLYTSGLMERPLLVFYLVGNAYMFYACTRGAYLAWAADQALPRAVSVSLRFAALGLLLNAVCVHAVRVLSTASRLIASGVSVVPLSVDDFTNIALAGGIVIFSLGLGYPGARTFLIKARLWIRDRSRLITLRPLWSALVRGFPAITLDKPPSQLRDRLRIQRVRMTYYRRVIECRDGLLQISPYIVEPDGESDEPYSFEDQARMVLEALERRNRGDLPEGPVVAVAAPSSTSMEDEARVLLRLSSAVSTQLVRGAALTRR